jgi:hypothetical protein
MQEDLRQFIPSTHFSSTKESAAQRTELNKMLCERTISNYAD